MNYLICLIVTDDTLKAADLTFLSSNGLLMQTYAVHFQPDR